MNGKAFQLVISLTTLLLLSACGVTYHGRVIDADTKQPLEGAAVVAHWSEEQGTFAGGVSRLYDVKETLTDKNGDWSIYGPRGTRSEFMSNVYNILTFLTGTHYTLPPEFIVFKPGYCSFPNIFIVDICMKRMKTVNFGESKRIGEILELPQLTSREDRQKNLPGPIDGREKEKEFIKLINEERRNIGLHSEY